METELDERCAIGIDHGGTKIAAGLVSFPSAKVRHRRQLPTDPNRSAKDVLDDVLKLARELLEIALREEIDCAGIGLGVGELVDLQGNVTSGQTTAWADFGVQDALRKLAPARVESDVRAAAFAEAKFGAGTAADQFIYVTIGTGISYCLVQGGRPYAGAHGNAIVFASSPLTATCKKCGEVSEPILEDLASGPALARRYSESTGREVRRAEEVLAAANMDDQAALEIVTNAGRQLGVSVAWLINALDPEMVVVGGGLGLAGGPYWDALVESTRSHIWHNPSQSLPIVPAHLRNDAGIVGAAAAIYLA